ncbi:HTTM domain-containing protein [Natronorubrum sp. JWXQ-INN-674]|uniref:HTTM domain-containing protein n=1 Tax=Natronorubrum halalkaliphilum TaxID=2691917 RepID=A0A6B0VKC2_9EURY|nr:HTTM domain-containing protein [Natronorubrum halalkaliphilum]MXV61643.1 HTTM domain-containing protein [Natronorubrum halalkaliphilum]
MRSLHTIARHVRTRATNPTYIDFRSVSIDTRSLAVFRIAAALLIVADILLRSRNFGFFYTNEGVVPQSLAMEMTPDNAISVYYLTTDSTVIAALFVVQVLIALQLLIGYRTTIATVLSFLLVISLDHHNPLVLSYADVLFRLLLFWAIFLPLGERWSVDAVHADSEPRARITSLASAAILVQIVYMYFLNGYHKRESELWTGGEATPLIMGLDNTTFLLGEFMRSFPTLLQYGGLTWYYMLLFSWLLLVLRGRARLFLVAMFIGGHASFAITVRIGAFPYVAIAGLVLFLQTQFWDDANALLRAPPLDRARVTPPYARLERLGARLPQFGVDARTHERITSGLYSIALVIAVTSLLVIPAVSHMPIGGFVDDEGGPKERVDDTAATVAVQQPDWSVFAPHPRTSDRYYVFPAATADGEVIDVYNDREHTYDRPHDELQQQFDTYRERFYMNSVRRGGPDDLVSATLATHYCETWQEDRDVELTHVNMYYGIEDVTLETIDDPADRDREIRLIYGHGCGNNEPVEVAPPE